MILTIALGVVFGALGLFVLLAIAEDSPGFAVILIVLLALVAAVRCL
jgi:hypothetical protein